MAEMTDPLIHYGTQLGVGLTTAAALYIAKKIREIAGKVERFERTLYGDEKLDERNGIANIALENERRSLENRQTLNDLEEMEPKGGEIHGD